MKICEICNRIIFPKEYNRYTRKEKQIYEIFGHCRYCQNEIDHEDNEYENQ